jgi:NADH-quinone oxidoreductase subunit A
LKWKLNRHLGHLRLNRRNRSAHSRLSSWLGPKRKNPVKDTPFECGWIPLESPGERLNIKFYLIAILFVLFDIEIIFLFPWAVVFRELGPAGFFSMLTFVGVLVLGLIYAWKRGALEWE